MTYFLNVTSKCWIHKGINDRVSDIVDKVHVKNDAVVRNRTKCHQPGWEEGNDEHNSHDEKHQRCFYVCDRVVITEMVVMMRMFMVGVVVFIAVGAVFVLWLERHRFGSPVHS